jgi:hypothetical protein
MLPYIIQHIAELLSDKEIIKYLKKYFV